MCNVIRNWDKSLSLLVEHRSSACKDKAYSWYCDHLSPLSGIDSRAWQISKINRINKFNGINNGLINRCKLGLRLVPINKGLILINNRSVINTYWCVIIRINWRPNLHWLINLINTINLINLPSPVSDTIMLLKFQEADTDIFFIFLSAKVCWTVLW